MTEILQVEQYICARMLFRPAVFLAASRGSVCKIILSLRKLVTIISKQEVIVPVQKLRALLSKEDFMQPGPEPGCSEAGLR